MNSETCSPGWTIWNGSASHWNNVVAEFPDANIYQTTQWAEHKSTTGWKVIRLVYSENGTSIDTAVQCLFRNGPLRSCVVWVPGGPLGDLNVVTPLFVDLLKLSLTTPFLYIRFSAMRGADLDTSKQLTSHRWRKTTSTIGTKSSLVHYLDADQSVRLSRCSSNWKRNLKRSSRNPIPPYVWHNPDSTSLALAYSQMDDFKQINGVSLARPLEELESVIDVFRDRLILVRSDDDAGNPLAIRGVLCFHETAWDFIAVTTPLGRKSYASHAVFWMLAEECFQLGMKRFDLGGIDPINNRGVYDFKKGTGAVQVDYQGEWESSSPSWFRRVASRIISQRVS